MWARAGSGIDASGKGSRSGPAGSTSAATAASATAATAAVVELLDEGVGADVADGGLQRVGLLLATAATAAATAAGTEAAAAATASAALGEGVGVAGHAALVVGLLQRVRDRADRAVRLVVVVD